MKLKIIFAVLCTTVRIFALPGIVDFMPSESGDYVFYRDTTFHDETYVGFLLFDDTTIGLRYYSPNTTFGSKNIEILISLKPESAFVEIAAEKVTTPTTADDVEKLNYLHDMLYEFGIRRKNINGKNLAKTLRTEDDFHQFGGKVTILYDSYVPIFNIRRILAPNGNAVLDMVAMGSLEDNDDLSFAYFTGMPEFNMTPDTIFSLPSEYESEIIESGFMNVKLPNYWEQKTDSVWVLENNAVLILELVAIDEKAFKGKKFTDFDYFLKTFLSNNRSVSINIPQVRLEKTKNTLRVENISLSLEDYVTTRDIKFMTKLNSSTYALFILTVTNPVFLANENYFREIEKSIKIKKK
ncbi:MAG: hypothetical protein ACRC4W_08895 [Treponemataceae bacterium]